MLTRSVVIALVMWNFMAKFARVQGFCKDFAKNLVNESGDLERELKLI